MPESHARKQPKPHWAVLPSVLLFLLLSCFSTIYPNLVSLAAANGNEGWNAYHTRDLLQGKPLYPQPISWTINNYPPASFIASALLAPLCGGELYSGRWLSVLGLVLLSLSFGWILSFRMPPAYAIWGGAFLFFYFTHAFPAYVGTNDPQLLALGLAMLGLSMAIHPSSRPLLSAVFLVLSMTVKLNSVGIVITAFLCLWLTKRPEVWRLLTYLTALGIATAALLHLLWGADLWRSILATRSVSLDNANMVLRLTIDPLGRCLFVAALYFSLVHYSGRREPAFVFLTVCAIFGVIFMRGGGVSYNIFFDVFIAGNWILFLLLWKLLGERWDTLSGKVYLLLLPFVSVATLAPETLYHWRHFSFASLSRQQKEQRDLVSYLSARPGNAACDSHLLCFLAGKPLDLDFYWANESLKTGRVSEADYIGLIYSRRFHTLQLELPSEVDIDKPFKHGKLPPKILEAIFANYRLDWRNQFVVFLIPRPEDPKLPAP